MADYATKKDVDIIELERYLGSLDYTIPTISILNLKKEIESRMSANDCGCIIYGKSRAGKSRAIHYISEHLKAKYGTELPIYYYCATDHVSTQKAFYSSLLFTLGHEDASRGTAVQMRDRIIKRLIVDSLDTKYRRAVLFVDEAYLLDEKEYKWLIDIYNALDANNILFTVFLVGTRELLLQKQEFIRAKKEQIVYRFMVHEFEFKGITSKKEMTVCMAALDKPFTMSGKEIVLSKLFFPNGYTDNKNILSFTDELWEAFEMVKKEHGIGSDELLMKHFMDAVIHCLKEYGSYGEGLYAPTLENWKDSIVSSGFVSSQAI